MEKLIGILKGIRPDVDFETATDLVDSGIIDSFDIVTLVVEMNEAFEIEIGVEDIIPEHFNSVAAMMALVDRLSE